MGGGQAPFLLRSRSLDRQEGIPERRGNGEGTLEERSKGANWVTAKKFRLPPGVAGLMKGG